MSVPEPPWRIRMEPRPLVLGVADAARMLGISRALAYDLARRQRLPVVRLGRRIVVPEAAIRALLAEATQTPS